MNQFDKLDLFLSEIKDRQFTVFGKPNKYTIRNFAGIGHHVEDENRNLIATVDDYESTPDMLVFSVAGVGKKVKQKVVIDAIEFVDAIKEVAA